MGVATADWVITGDIVTMDAERTIVADGAVAVTGNAIAAVGKADDIRRQFPDSPERGSPGSLVTPGFVNAHQHLTADRLVASAIPDDLPPGAAIFEWIVPVHNHVTGGDDELSATLGLIEAATNGITTVIDAGTVAHPDRVAQAMAAVGVRGAIGRWGSDADGLPQSGPVDEVIEAQRDLLKKYPPGGLVEASVTLVGHDLMSDDLLTTAADLARTTGSRLSFHLSPTPDDANSYLERTGLRPLVHLDRLGVLGPNVLVGHAVHIDDAELETLVRTGTAVASCPWAYLRLGQGLTERFAHLDLWRRGGRMALGCDTENAGDAIDGLRAAALFAGLAKDTSADPTEFGAHHAFEMLTIAGAEAVGMADRIGSLEAGKTADIVVIDRSGIQWQPPSPDPILQLVWAGGGRSVADVLIDGRLVVADGRCTTVDVDLLQAEARLAARSLIERSGIQPRSLWPLR
ncbi:amidohydrolase family protein [Candidatus Poriferisocius sp.]|uniref:amidohydrolase family protein n=1 Tax=Candidatus Poriferisocius sp. TaxID=3101276 RepID=UPI003B529566